ncbi:hypothetical protein [Streptomyces sp. STR69]|uniref:hypothetical protein n=1 Tax=Streptomyces sp. STR69 TaxID=1796942 RepID=UPI0021C7A597|nr:hypothetical protein [Streptomyces sp. STR69]
MSASEDAVTSLVNGGYAPQIAREILAAVAAEARSETERHWAAKIREVGTAKGWSVWASAYMDPDVPFTDIGMPSTETIVAELRRLDRVAVLREAADAITDAIEADRAYSPRRSNDRAALGGAREIVLGLIDKPRRTADDTGREKDTSDDHQTPAGESTPAPHALRSCATESLARATNDGKGTTP